MCAKSVWMPLSGTVVGVALLTLALTGCEQKKSEAAPTPPPKRLTVLTPHSAGIRDAFGTGFWNWYLEKHGRPVEITWIHRGTPQCIDYVRSGRELRAAGARYDDADLLFGGGLTDHGLLADERLSVPVALGDAAAALPAEVHGVPSRDPRGHWFATGLSSFGILFHQEGCQQRGIAPPTTWSDLADPRFRGWLAVADPRASGSHRECMVVILQQQGWEAGWATILRVLGNARALDAQSADALRQVSSGTALATFAVNFDGMAAAAEAGGRLQYIDPPGATSVTPDLVSALGTTRDIELVKEFVQYVLSAEGQALWGVMREYRQPWGPTLYHYPIMPAAYEQPAEQMCVTRNPLQEDFGVRLDPKKAVLQGALVRLLAGAACQDGNHVQLQQLWDALGQRGLPADILAALTAPPCDEAAALELAGQVAQAQAPELEQLRKQWTASFAARYAEVRAQLGL